MNIHKTKRLLFLFAFLILSTGPILAQIINDPLQGTTVGNQVGGSFTSEGYRPGSGQNHILYTVPSQVPNGYIEFEMKGFSPSDFSSTGNDHAFLIMFDGRGVGSTPSWNNFRDNYFRWNFHWRQSASAFKCVVNCAAPTSARLNSNYAVFQDEDGDGSSIDDRDWYDEPSGSSFSWDTNKNTWYTVKVEWNNKTYKVYVNGQNVWSNHEAGLYDYNPVDFKIWLGSGVDKYDSDLSDVVYKNFKLYSLGGSSNYLGISPSSETVSSSMGSTTLSLTSNINWSVSDNVNWLDVSPSTGSDDATLNVSYDENTESSSRTATITAAGDGMTRTVSITQEGVVTSNYLTVSPSNKNVSASANSTTLSVESDLSWTVSVDVDWIIVSPLNGNGNSTVDLNYSENTGTSPRTGTLTFEGGGITREVSIIQSGVAAEPYLNITPLTQNVSASSGSSDFQISSNVSWSISDDSDWLFKSPKEGLGDGTFTANYDQNISDDFRVATITISGGGISKSVVVNQSGANPYLNIIPENQDIGSSDDSTVIIISSNLTWNITNNADWLSISDSNGIGNKSVTVLLQDNLSALSRSASVLISGEGIEKSATIIQAGADAFLNFSSDSINVSDSAGTASLTVSSNFTWLASSNADWVTFSSDSGNGDTDIEVLYEQNHSDEKRTAIILFSGLGLEKQFVLIQMGATYYNITAESFPDEAGTIEGTGFFEMNTQVTLSAIPNAGWKFDNWTEINEVVSYDSTITVNVDSAKHLIANFTTLTDVGDFADIPYEYSLSNNYPNPFNPTTNIEFSIPENTNVKLSIYNLLGQRMKILIDDYKTVGSYSVTVEASDLPSGMYLYKIETDNFTKIKKMQLIK